MKDRLKEIRKSSNYGKNQQEFADYLGISLSNLASYESGRRNPSDAVISLICQKCQVNEEWIRKGTGEMKAPTSKESEVAKLAANLYGADPDSFQYKVAMYLNDLPLEDWKKFEELIRDLANKVL